METNTFWYRLNVKLTYWSLIALAIGIFTSISLTALHHIFIFLPCFYFTYIHFQKNGWEGLKVFSPSQWALFGFIIVIFISIWVNRDIMYEPAIKRTFVIKYFLFPLFGYFAYVEAFSNYIDTKKRKILIHLFLISATVASISGLIGIELGYNPLRYWRPIMQEGRNNGLTAIMDYSYGISLLLILISGALVYRDKIKEYISTKWLIFYFLANLIGLYFTYARGAWIGFCLAFPLLLWGKNRKLFYITAGFCLVVPLLAIKMDNRAEKRFLHSGGSNGKRVAQFKSSFMAFKEKPIFGWGFGNFGPHSQEIKRKYNIEYPEYKGNSYNSFLESLAGTGIFGLLFFALFHFCWAWEGKRAGTHFGTVVFVFVISYLISAQVQYTFGDSENLFLIMGVYSISMALLPKKETLESFEKLATAST